MPQQQQQPPLYLTPPQQQLLQYLQQNSTNLTLPQQNMLHQLQSQYRLMQQHQMRQRATGVTGVTAPPPRTGSAPYSSSVSSPQNQNAQTQKSPANAVKSFPVTTTSSSVSNVFFCGINRKFLVSVIYNCDRNSVQDFSDTISQSISKTLLSFHFISNSVSFEMIRASCHVHMH